jgi:hypothetical protein
VPGVDSFARPRVANLEIWVNLDSPSGGHEKCPGHETEAFFRRIEIGGMPAGRCYPLMIAL